MKKVIICVCIVVVILALIGFKVFNSMRTVNIPEDNSVAVEEQESLEDKISNSNEENAVVQETVHKDGKIIASNGVEFDEEDLKSKIGIYLIYDNFMNDYFVPEQNNENANIVDYSNEAKVFIGSALVSSKNPERSSFPTEEQVRKAIEEYCGEHYERFIDTTEYWMAFDGDNAYEFVQAGDYDPTGYCNSIESITEQGGKYTVTFIYSRPSDSDFIDETVDQVQKYRKSMTFIYHDDAKYTNYQLTELSFLQGEEV